MDGGVEADVEADVDADVDGGNACDVDCDVEADVDGGNACDVDCDVDAEADDVTGFVGEEGCPDVAVEEGCLVGGGGVCLGGILRDERSGDGLIHTPSEVNRCNSPSILTLPVCITPDDGSR